jgi:uncharacterized protein YbjT (DUF2867 family)
MIRRDVRTVAMSETVFVTGAAGTTGSELVRLLADRGTPVRAGVHTPANAPGWSDDVEVVAIDFGDRASLVEAFAGASKLYLVTPFAADTAALVETAVGAAAEAGVAHVVRLSAVGADSPAMLPARWHRAAEDVVRESGLAYTFLRPTFFVQNLLLQADAIADGAFYNTVGPDVGISHVDARDVARVAATVLTEDGHEGAAYELTGPSSPTFAEIAATLSDVLGHDVQYVRISEADQREALAEMGMPGELIDAYVDLLAWADTGAADGVTTDVEDVTGVPATPFETFLRDHADTFRRSDRTPPASV